MRTNKPWIWVVFLALVIVAPALAQDVYVTAPDNKINVVNFDTGDVENAISDNGKNFQGLATRTFPGALRLIAANKTQGGDIRIYDPKTGQGNRVVKFKDAHGVAVDMDGNAYAVNQHKGRKDQVLFLPLGSGCDRNALTSAHGCLPGGYAGAYLIDQDVKVGGQRTSELADVRLASGDSGGLVSNGDLVVLVKDPPRLIKYREDDFAACHGKCDPMLVLDEDALAGYRPTGLELSPRGILVTTDEGVVLLVSEQMGVTPFAPLPGKGAKLTAGIWKSETVSRNVVIASTPNKSGIVTRFVVDMDGMIVDEKQLKKNIRPPEGVALVNGGGASVASGLGVEFQMPTINSVADHVIDAGFASADCQLYTPDCLSDPDGCTNLEQLDPVKFPDVVIPKYIRPFPIGDLHHGPLAYFVCDVDTTADFVQAISNIEDEEQFLRYEPPCETLNSNVTQEARFFYAPDLSEDAQIIEASRQRHGTIFTDISNGCGNSNIGRGWDFSFLMPAARDTRDVCTILDFKLTNLSAALADFGDEGWVSGACNDIARGSGPPIDWREAKLNPSEWSFVRATHGTFGTTSALGNGYLLGGGAVTFQVHEAAWDHQFGVANAVGRRVRTPILRHSARPPAGPISYSPGADPYVFYFKNLSHGLAGKVVYSDRVGPTRHGLEMAIYQNKDNPGKFALFFDDGGSGPDRDFSDLVVIATGSAEGTLCNLEVSVQHALDAYGSERVCRAGKSNLTGAVGWLQDGFLDTVRDPGNAADFDNSERNVIGELDGRAESASFMACKVIPIDDRAVTICPIAADSHDPHH